MEGPLVTVLTPTYQGHRDYIRTCIESVVGQTYPHWELLIRDDGSLADIVSEYRDERIRYSSQPPRPVSELYRTYNDLVAESRGEYFAELEGDDKLPPDKLERQLEIHRRHPEVSASFGVAQRISEGDDLLSTWGIPDRLPSDQPFDAREPLLFGCPFCASTAMVPRWALDRVGGFAQGMPFPDYHTWMKLARVGPFYASSDHLGYWRVHANTSTEHMLAIATGGRSLAETYHVDGADRVAVARYWTAVEAEVLAAVGRDALSRRDWSRSRASFFGSLSRRLRAMPPPPFPVAKSLLGLFLAALHVPVPAARQKPSRVN